MNKEQQDKLWKELSEESKRIIIKEFEYSKIAIDSDEKNREAHIGACATLDMLFGTHNLNPEPKIKTWDDVEENYNEYYKYVAVSNSIEEGIINIEDKLRLKLLATYRIAKLIELGYGGMVSEEEWKSYPQNSNAVFYSIICNHKGKLEKKEVEYEIFPVERNFITFHSLELLEEFMSQESNRKLVEQYYMM